MAHYAALRRKGVEDVERETFESSLRLARKAIEKLGCPPYEARERADRYRRENIASLEALLPHWDDEKQRIAIAIQARLQLEQQFEKERVSQQQRRGIQGWHYEPVIIEPVDDERTGTDA